MPNGDQGGVVLMPGPFARVVPLTMPPNVGKFAVESIGARWGVYDTPEEAQEKADRLNDTTT